MFNWRTAAIFESLRFFTMSFKHKKGFPQYNNPSKGDLIIQFLVEDLVGKDYEEYLSNVDEIRKLFPKDWFDEIFKIEYADDRCETVECVDYIEEEHGPDSTEKSALGNHI